MCSVYYIVYVIKGGNMEVGGEMSAEARLVFDRELLAVGDTSERITALADSDRFVLRVMLAGPVLYNRTVTFETTGLRKAMGDDAAWCMSQRR